MSQIIILSMIHNISVQNIEYIPTNIESSSSTNNTMMMYKKLDSNWEGKTVASHNINVSKKFLICSWSIASLHMIRFHN